MVLKTEILYFFPPIPAQWSDGITPKQHKAKCGSLCYPWVGEAMQDGLHQGQGVGWETLYCFRNFWFKSQSYWLFDFVGLTIHFKDIAINKKYSETPSGIKDNY